MSSRSMLTAALLVAALAGRGCRAGAGQRGNRAGDRVRCKAAVGHFFRGADRQSSSDLIERVRRLWAMGRFKDRNDDINKLIEQATASISGTAPIRATKLVARQAVGGDLIFLRYLYKGEKFPGRLVLHVLSCRGQRLGVKRDWHAHFACGSMRRWRRWRSSPLDFACSGASCRLSGSVAHVAAAAAAAGLLAERDGKPGAAGDISRCQRGRGARRASVCVERIHVIVRSHECRLDR